VATHDPAEAAPTLAAVIDHHEAKVLHLDTREGETEWVVPYDPRGHGRHLHSAHEWTDGKPVPERKSYYEAVAKTLAGAGRIVLLGGGTGRSSAMDQLMADLNDHHPDMAAKVVGFAVVDAHHTNEPQLLAQARAILADAVSREVTATEPNLRCRAMPESKTNRHAFAAVYDTHEKAGTAVRLLQKDSVIAYETEVKSGKLLLVVSETPAEVEVAKVLLAKTPALKNEVHTEPVPI